MVEFRANEQSQQEASIKAASIKDASLKENDRSDDGPSKLLEDSGFLAPESAGRNLAQNADKAGTAAKPRTAGEIVADHYIVTLKEKPLGKEKENPLLEDKVAKIMTRAGLIPRNVPDLLIYKHAISGFSGELTAQQLQALQNDPDVAAIEPDRVVGINPARVGQAHNAKTGTEVPTGVARVEADQSTTANTPGGVDVDIAVIDTGINLKHSELNVVNNVSFIPGAKTGDDDHGHGSHVAGTIGAIKDGKGVVGVAPGARLWAVKTLDRSGYGTMAQVIAGVDYVTQHADEIEVANMSLGDKEQSKAFDEAISKSVEAGVTYVVAAGNESDDAKDYSPANHKDVLTVSAVADSDGKGGGTGGRTCEWDKDAYLASFSNYGANVKIAAPGSCIESTWKASASNTDRYNTISGTSMASPHVAGAAGLVKAKHPEYSPKTVIKTLIDNAKPQNDPDYGFKGDKDSYPEPMLNAKKL